MENGELALLVDGEGRVVKTLHGGPGFPDVPHMPFTDMHRVVTAVGEDFSHCHFLSGQSETRDIDCRVAHAIAEWMPACHKRNPGGSAGGLGVHAGQAHAVTREFINIRRLVAADRIECFIAEITEADVIDQYVENVG